MASTIDYSDIYSRFYLRVRDYDIAAMDKRTANEILSGYLRSTLSQPMVRRLFMTLDADDDVEEIEYELRDPLDEDSDNDFVMEMLAMGMCI